MIVRPKNAADLPPPIEDGNTVREVIWGAADQAELDRNGKPDSRTAELSHRSRRLAAGDGSRTG